MAAHRIHPRQHARIGGDFLIGAESAKSPPCHRVEPVQRQHDQGDPIGDQVTARVMAKLMRQRQIALFRLIAFGEIAREGDVTPPNPEGERAGGRFGLDDMHAIRRVVRARPVEQAAAEAVVGKRVPADERDRPRHPEQCQRRPKQRQRGPECGQIRRGGLGSRRNEQDRHLLGRALHRRNGGSLPPGRGKRRQQQPQHRQQPQRISDLCAERFPHGTAQQQHRNHQHG